MLLFYIIIMYAVLTFYKFVLTFFTVLLNTAEEVFKILFLCLIQKNISYQFRSYEKSSDKLAQHFLCLGEGRIVNLSS